MSDDGFSIGSSGRINEGEDLFPKTRSPNVTDNLNTNFDLLSNAHRRYLLYYLFNLDGDVAEFEAAVNAVYRYEAAGTDTNEHVTRESIRTRLHHIHLPRLLNAGVVDYDPRHGTVRFTGSPALEEWVEHAQYKELD